MSAALFDILRKLTTATITTMLLKKGIRRCWMNGPKLLIHTALRAGARRLGDAGELGEPGLNPRRDRKHAGRSGRGRRCNERAERRNLWRHPLRTDEEAQRRGAGHGRRQCVTAPVYWRARFRCGAPVLRRQHPSTA